MLAVLGATLLILVSLSPGTTAPFRDERGQEISGSVAEIQFVTLGGIAQFVVIRARDTTNLVPYEEPEKFLRVLVEKVRPLATQISRDSTR